MFAGQKSAQIREILINESAWEDMTCLFAPSLKINCLPPKKHWPTKITVVAKTILKSLPVPINFNLSDDDRKKLYESIDFSGCLIILEDLERSGMSILDVLGFVNNLVEQDGVKVLLVANEDEIMKYQYEGRLIGKSEKDEIDNYNQACIQM